MACKPELVESHPFLQVAIYDFTGKTTSLQSLPSLEGGIGHSLSSDPPKITADGADDNELYIHMLDTQLPYGHEFYGCDVSLAITPMTERCFLTLTQVI